ncbi:hypothetical protein DL765_008564 [Monosporascus sp. GIB2]|nr:hypothetical protein DL765_008564 [Monosporascus sp. GIB2]
MEAVGIAASVVALSDALLKGCKSLKMLRDSLKDAPNEVERLYRAMNRLQQIMTEIQVLGQDIDGLWTDSALALNWTDHVVEITTDIASVNKILAKLQDSFSKPSIMERNLAGRFRKFFSEKELDRHEKILVGHQETFTLLLGVINERRSRAMFEQITRQGQMLQSLSRPAKKEYVVSMTTETSTEVPTQIAACASIAVSDQLKVMPCEQPRHQYTRDLLQAAVLHEQPCLQLRAVNAGGLVSPSMDTKTDAQLPLARKPYSVITRFEIYCRIFQYDLPLGIIYGTRLLKKKTTKAFKTAKKESKWLVDIALHPLPTLTNSVFRLLVGWSSNGVFTFSPRRHSFNRDPELKQCLDRGDISGLCRMFSDGRAAPDDLLAPWGNSLLHEAITRHAVGVPNIEDGMTPLIHCCKLMLEAPQINCRMLSVARLMMQSGADLSYRDEEGSSSCILIFQSTYGIEFLQDFVCQYIDLDTYGNFESTDLWLISSMARCIPSFLRRLEAEARELRTPPEISSSIHPRLDHILALTPEAQVSWLKSSEPQVRAPFMRAICSYGTVEMALPFIDSGIDLDEAEHPEAKSYIRSAARNGNLDVVMALLKAGARIDQPTWHWRTSNLCTSVLDEFIERWRFIWQNQPVQGRAPPDVDSEFWILPLLLQESNHTSPNALYTALWEGPDPPPLRPLLQHGYGRRDGQPPRTDHERDCGSEVIEAVKNQRAYLGAMLRHGLALECEDRFGCTAALYAVDLGSVEALELLYKAGADLTRRTGYGITPLELATSNLEAEHPRPTQRAWAWAWSNQPDVSLEQDMRVYSFLKAKLKEKRHAIPLLLYNKSVASSVALRRSKGWELALTVVLLLLGLSLWAPQPLSAAEILLSRLRSLFWSRKTFKNAQLPA